MVHGAAKVAGPIRAECQSDGQLFVVSFDARAWFEQASDEEILQLAACGWGGDYPADEVARFFENLDNEVAFVLGRGTGFECRVDGIDAVAWVRARRPELIERMASLMT